MSTILDRLHQTGTAMDDEEVRVQLGMQLKQAAIRALMAGIGQKPWNDYMSLFANNQQQLTRLTVAAENEDWRVTESRAYIVANSICGADSTTQTSLRVEDIIDGDLDAGGDGSIVDPVDGQPAVEGTIVRPFRIP